MIDIAKGLGTIWLVFAVNGAIGLALGTLIRSSAAALGVGLIYVLAVEVLLVRFIDSLNNGTYQWIGNLFVNQNATALTQSFHSAAFGPSVAPSIGAGRARVVAVNLLFGTGALIASYVHAHFAWFGVVLLLVETLPLWWRRRFPVAVLAVVLCAEIARWALQLSNEPSGPALVFAVYAVSVYGQTRERLLVAAAPIPLIPLAVPLPPFRPFPSSPQAIALGEATARDPLAGVNRLLGVPRKQDDAPLAPQPGLDQVDALLKAARDAGLEAALKVTGERRPLPAALDLSAYRIIQEAVTNVLKHANATRIELSIDYQPRSLVIAVSDNGSGATETVGGSAGHGLIGMRERGGVFDGGVGTGWSSLGGFPVRAKLHIN